MASYYSLLNTTAKVGHNKGVKKQEAGSASTEQDWLDRFWEIFSADFERAGDYKGKDAKLGTLARFAIEKGLVLEDFYGIDAFHELQEEQYEAVHNFKPRKAIPDSKSGSLHRLLRYIELKRELASPGMSLKLPPLMPQKPLVGGEVMELRLSFPIETGSEYQKLFNTDNGLVPAPIKP